jgi:hypothetical protein
VALRRGLPTPPRHVLRQTAEIPRRRSLNGDGSHCRHFETFFAKPKTRNAFSPLAQKLDSSSGHIARGIQGAALRRAATWLFG